MERDRPVAGRAAMAQAAGQVEAAVTGLPAAWVAAGHPGGSGSVVAGKIALIAVAVIAVGAFTILQIKARASLPPPAEHNRGRYDPVGWRVPPAPYGTEGQHGEAPFGNEERYRPDWRYGYPPRRDPGTRLRSTGRDDARRGRGS